MIDTFKHIPKKLKFKFSETLPSPSPIKERACCDTYEHVNKLKYKFTHTLA